MGRALIACGGWQHPRGLASERIEQWLGTIGYTPEVIDTPSDVATALQHRPELLVVASCWFSMTDGRYNDAQRDAFAVQRDSEREDALLAYLDAGGPMLALHTAVICFDDWPEWQNRLGGGWHWGSSSHPPPDTITVQPDSSGPMRFEPFEVTDERYQQLRIADESVVIARSTQFDPVIWRSASGVLVDVLGHDQRAYTAEHLDLLERLLTDFR